jgi:hypothetical protein
MSQKSICRKQKYTSAQILGPMPSCGERVMIVAVGIGSTIDLCEVNFLPLIYFVGVGIPVFVEEPKVPCAFL